MAELIRELGGERLTIFFGTFLEIEWALPPLRDDDRREQRILSEGSNLKPQLKYYVKEGKQLRAAR